LQINNLKNEVKPIAKELTSDPKNEHEMTKFPFVERQKIKKKI
jgi:hypothetical protein